MNVYRIAFDIRIGRLWLAGGGTWDSRNVLARGDGRDACSKLERAMKRTTIDGKHPSAVRIITVETVATQVLT